MANKRRGEINAELDGKTYTLCLTLGALAELEDAFSAKDMIALTERFASGRLSAKDAVKIIGAGMRGGGHDVSDADIAAMHIAGGAKAFAEIVVRLLSATFAGDREVEPDPARPTRRRPKPGRPISRGTR